MQDESQKKLESLFHQWLNTRRKLKALMPTLEHSHEMAPKPRPVPQSRGM